MVVSQSVKPKWLSRTFLKESLWRGACFLAGFSNKIAVNRWKNLRGSRIFDCFSFFNELSLLEIRLEELHETVDYFVLVEATRTHSGNPKPLFFQENRNRFAKFLHQIIHIVVEDMPPLGREDRARFHLEYHQRNAITRGLNGCKDSDIILISDVDEIPDARRFGQLFLFLKLGIPAVCFRQKHYYYYLNGCIDGYWSGTAAFFHETLARKFGDPQEIRHLRSGFPWIDRGGWHFSYLGGADAIAQKIHSFAHDEYDSPEYTDRNAISERVRLGLDLFQRDMRIVYVPLDEGFPKTITADPERFRDFLRDPAVSPCGPTE